MAEEPVAIISGAGRGIGRAVATDLAARGFRLVLLSRTEIELRATADATGVECLVHRADVRDAEACSGTVRATLERFGRVDVLVHCAGVAPVRSVLETTPQLWRDVLDTNLSAAFYLARAVWPVFTRQGGGVIVNLSSFSARDPFAGFAAYGAAKAGVNLLGLSLAREGAAVGIRVHTVAPAAVETEMFRQILTPEQFSTDKTLLPGEVASVVWQCINGDLACTSGEVIWVQKRV